MSSYVAQLGPFLLSVENLSGGPASEVVFENLNFSWSAGLHWVHGDEGSGKTSLLRILAGDLLPIKGAVKRSKGGVFWADLNPAIHDELTVQACWEKLQGQHPFWCNELLNDLSQELDMNRHRLKRLDMLSTGSRHKVMLIAALASGATTTLLDQPFASLDAASIKIIKDFLTDAADQPDRAWIVADYVAPQDLPIRSHLKLGA